MSPLVRPHLCVIGLLALTILQSMRVAAEQGTTAASHENQETDSIVQRALDAEVHGDATLRQSLLATALKKDRQHSAANWHSGHVRIDGTWQTVDEAEQIAAKGTKVAGYRNLRDRYSGRLDGELILARWCRKHGFRDRERMHWTSAIRFDPENGEARSRLGVREFHGRLLTGEQITEWKRGVDEYQRALKDWDPRLNLWRREIESSSLPHITDAWAELMSVEDPDAVPSLEKALRKADLSFQRAVVMALGNIEDQISTDALVRIAMHAEESEMRDAASVELSERSWFAFVPNLLSRLALPIEYRYAMKTLGSGIHSEFSATQETADAFVNVSKSVSLQAPVKIVSPQRRVTIDIRPYLAQKRLLANEAARQYRQLNASVQIANARNARNARLNRRIFAALTTSTGQQLDDRPESWWDWWRDYNEQDASVEKPTLEYSDQRGYWRPIVYGTLSCFVAGTRVWTETGPLVVEDVKRGDRVLSQDPESGELSYKIVMDTTVRPSSPTLRIQTADAQVVATLGHPFWVVGKGWVMAKDLQVEDRLHGVEGGVAISKIEPGPSAQAYNLIVPETNTYFVGDHRLLVHDNMARQAMSLPVPGWLATND